MPQRREDGSEPFDRKNSLQMSQSSQIVGFCDLETRMHDIHDKCDQVR